MARSEWASTAVTQSHIDAAWWACVVEPGDELAFVLRQVLGDEAARGWVLADRPTALPQELLTFTGGQFGLWKKAFERWRPRALEADPEGELELLVSLGGHLLIPSDALWPAGLDSLGALCPAALWVLGAAPVGGGVAIVGARSSTQYGNFHARELASFLAIRGIPVVSGGAFGIDIHAHRGTLDVGGCTVAVMAGGVGELYPRSHQGDFRRILDSGGSVISEVPPMWRPARWRFLGRNRVIAALSDATVVVEAGMRSGALSTARHALEIGREVGAFPGAVSNEMAKGCHELIRHGATLVRGGQDVMELIGGFEVSAQGVLFGDPVESDSGIGALPPSLRRVWEALPVKCSAALSAITRESALGEREVLAALAGLELAGLVTSSGGKWRRSVAK